MTATSAASATSAADAAGTAPPGSYQARYRALSLWHDTVPDTLLPRPGLSGDLDVDVAIVGAGFTGLWTAYYLRRADPGVRVAVLEREIAGFGASGRNGGWCSALFPASWDAVARRSTRAGAVALRRALEDTVVEVGRVCAAEGIDAHYARGGTLTLARTAVQEQRMRAELATARSYGSGEEDLRWLDRAEADARLVVAGARGGLFTPHCAAVHPARLVRGLARAVERDGTWVYERTAVREIVAPPAGSDRPRVRTDRGTVRADVVVRALEGYTAQLAGGRRVLAPVYSLMIATEPLPSHFFDQVGWRDRQTVHDGRHLIVYAQRTADDRIAFGGRGAPYRFGSAVDERIERDPVVHDALMAALVELFPALTGVRITHRWGGPLGVPRDWMAGVGLDRTTGLAWAGGYVGDGVGASHLAGRTLADLILARPTERTGLPWVGHRWPRWEPEPLRWLGLAAGLQVMARADGTEARTGRPSRSASAFGRLLGH